jgi:hypothetical protein
MICQRDAGGVKHDPTAEWMFATLGTCDEPSRCLLQHLHPICRNRLQRVHAYHHAHVGVLHHVLLLAPNNIRRAATSCAPPPLLTPLEAPPWQL